MKKALRIEHGSGIGVQLVQDGQGFANAFYEAASIPLVLPPTARVAPLLFVQVGTARATR
jgi:hypothetical protein